MRVAVSAVQFRHIDVLSLARIVVQQLGRHAKIVAHFYGNVRLDCVAVIE